MNRLVLCEGVLAGEDLPTSGASKLRSGAMGHLVFPQGAVVVETLAAGWATVASLIAVHCFVAT